MTRFLKHIPILFLFVLLSVLIVSILILSCVPPVSKDALTHHLAVPKLYLKHGGIHENPSIVFSYYPMNLDLLYMVPLYFGNDIIPKFIHFSFALFTAGLIFTYLRKRIDVFHALLGVVFFLSLPIIVKLSITVYVDLGLIFFSTASIITLFKWIENQYRVKFLIISAVWCGLALGTKYTGLISFLILALWVPFITARRTSDRTSGSVSRQVKAVAYGSVFVLVSLVVFSPWAIKNFLRTNNPIYPLYDNWFNSPAPLTDGARTTTPADPENSKRPLGHFALRNILYGESWWRIALIPGRIFFEGQDGSPQHFDGKLNPLLFFLPFFSLACFKRDTDTVKAEKTLMLVFAVLFLLVVFFMNDMRIRWISPIVPPLVILSVMGMHEITHTVADTFSEKKGRIFSYCVYGVVFLLFCLNVGYILEQFRIVDPMSYISGRVGRDAYIERFRREYPTYRFANANLPENVKILGLFLGNRLYYSDREIVFDENLLLRAVKQARSPESVSQHLRKHGITHLLVRYDLFMNWADNNFNEAEKESIAGFIKKNLDPLFDKNGYALLKLKEPPNASMEGY